MVFVLFENAGKQKYNAGSKARQDALKIAMNCGYKHITLFHNGNPRFFVAFEIIRGCFLAVCRAGKGDTVLIQFPYYPPFLNKLLFGVLRIGKRIKKYDITVLIHDLSGLRNHIYGEMSKNAALNDELHMMRGCNLIYHNKAMRDVCESVCPATSYQILGLFDYLYSGKTCPRKYSEKPVVMIAGNLGKEKSGYIYQLPVVKNIRFDLFGANYEGGDGDNIRYRGKFAPEELIAHLDGQFGLVWDGDTINTCSGTTGNYLRYNNPHKLSLYIAAGVPVIVWKESALAGFVERNRLGICVNSIKDMPPILEKISDAEYAEMLACVEKVKKVVQCGKKLERILQEHR